MYSIGPEVRTINVIGTNKFFGFLVWGRVPGWWLKFRGGGASCVEAPFQIFRIYIKWSLGLKHFLCWGGGNVTFDVYNSSRHIVVSVRHSGPL